MKMRLIYAITCCILLAILVFASVKIQRLETINSDWSAACQLLQQDYDASQLLWNNEREQWRGVVESRDGIIEWYKEQSPTTIILPPVVETITVNQTIEKRMILDGWDTLAELEEWLANDDTDKLLLYSPNHLDGGNTCMIYASRLRLEAEMSGKYLSWQVITAKMYEELFGVPSDIDHMMNIAYICDEQMIYLIEPRTDEVWAWEKVIW